MERLKRLFIAILMLASLATAQAQDLTSADGKKVAILMVHFGTTYDDTRALTIDAINDKVSQTFPGIEVREAYTSRIVIKRLKSRGITKPTPRQALLQLAADGFSHIIVQGTNVIDGIEAEVLRDEAALMSPFFEEIRVGRPLLYSVDDCRRVASILASRYDSSTEDGGAVVMIGHGTSTPANAIYSQMDYIFTADGHPAFHVATVEGYPTLPDAQARLKADGATSVTLIPFMFVAGDHARNDIDGEMRESLTEAGFTVSTILEGLGQIPEIQDLYIDHIKAALTAPVPNAAARKSSFIMENL